jgi:hypothetical protein
VPATLSLLAIARAARRLEMRLQKQNTPDRDETCLTDRSRLMIVYRLITNYSRRGRDGPKINPIGRNETS